MPVTDSIRQEYVEIANAYLESLEWTQKDLAERMGSSRSQVSGWLGKLDRGIARDDVCRMAWAIAGGLDGAFGSPRAKEPPVPKEKAPAEQHSGRSELDYHMNRLLDAAGYKPIDGYPEDRVWQRLTKGEAVAGAYQPAVVDEFQGLGELVKDYLNQLSWSPKILAERMGSSSFRSIDLSNNLEGGLGKDDICRMAWAVAGGLDRVFDSPQSKERPPDESKKERGRLDYHLDRLLVAAGYTADKGQPENRIWEQFAVVNAGGNGRVLKVGWVDLRPMCFAEREEDDRPTGGLVVDITQRLADYMGVGLVWKRCDWSDLIPALRSGGIDLVAAMALHFPRRMFEMRFSRTLPYLRSGLNCVIHKDYLERVTRSRRAAPVQAKDVKFESLCFEYVPGNMGEFGHRHFRSRGQLPEARPLLNSKEWRDVIERPVDEQTGKVRCFVTGQLTCYNIIKENKNCINLFTWGNSVAKLPYAFGVSYTEPRLIDIVDTCLYEIFRDEPWIDEVLDFYEAELTKAGVYERDREREDIVRALVREIQARPQATQSDGINKGKRGEPR